MLPVRSGGLYVGGLWSPVQAGAVGAGPGFDVVGAVW